MSAISHVQAIGYIGTRVRFVIDRPRGTSHPEFPELIYEIDYGFIPHTQSGDGEQLDAYILEPLGARRDDQGVCVGAILRKDSDDKLVIVAGVATWKVPPGLVWQLTAFQEKYFWPEVYADTEGRYMLTQDGAVQG
jgi:inorganic pyrophosphatase